MHPTSPATARGTSRGASSGVGERGSSRARPIRSSDEPGVLLRCPATTITATSIVDTSRLPCLLDAVVADRDGGGTPIQFGADRRSVPVPADYDGDFASPIMATVSATLHAAPASGDISAAKGRAVPARPACGDIPVPEDWLTATVARISPVFRPTNGIAGTSPPRHSGFSPSTTPAQCGLGGYGDVHRARRLRRADGRADAAVYRPGALHIRCSLELLRAGQVESLTTNLGREAGRRAAWRSTLNGDGRDQLPDLFHPADRRMDSKKPHCSGQARRPPPRSAARATFQGRREAPAASRARPSGRLLTATAPAT